MLVSLLFYIVVCNSILLLHSLVLDILVDCWLLTLCCCADYDKISLCILLHF